jgi:hypothetical protein
MEQRVPVLFLSRQATYVVVPGMRLYVKIAQSRDNTQGKQDRQ